MSDEKKTRPYLFCHMETSLDGKIMGNFWDVLDDDGNPFYSIAFGEHPFYHHQGWISGRVTTDDNFTHNAKPLVNEDAPEVPAGDFITDAERGMYYVSIDPHGKLGWQSDEVHYHTTVAKVIEVLTEEAPNAYKDFLRRMNIPYLICGEKRVDFAVLLDKLQDSFGFECVMLGGGGTVNWSMMQQGLVDELSLVLDPSADGSTTTQSLFVQKDGLSTTDPKRFFLLGAQRVGSDRLWLRYRVDNG